MKLVLSMYFLHSNYLKFKKL